MKILNKAGNKIYDGLLYFLNNFNGFGIFITCFSIYWGFQLFYDNALTLWIILLLKQTASLFYEAFLNGSAVLLNDFFEFISEIYSNIVEYFNSGEREKD